MKSIDPLKPLWREDAEGKAIDPEAFAGELLAGQRWRRLRTWFSTELDAWTARLEKIGKWLKAIAMVLGSLAAILALIKQLRTRNSVGPAELPKDSGERTFIDRVDKPTPPRP